jgi:hypothetical protein
MYSCPLKSSEKRGITNEKNEQQATYEYLSSNLRTLQYNHHY